MVATACITADDAPTVCTAFGGPDSWTRPPPKGCRVNATSKVPLPFGGHWPPSKMWFLGPHESVPKQHFNWFSHFCGLTVVTKIQSHRTSTTCIGIARI